MIIINRVPHGYSDPGVPSAVAVAVADLGRASGDVPVYKRK